jgi:hypothetical protein
MSFQWLRSFLTNRNQKVTIGKALLKPLKLMPRFKEEGGESRG